MKLEELKKSLAEKVEGLEDLKTAAFAEDATEEHTKALSDALSEIDELEKKIKTAQRVEDLQKAQSKPADTPSGDQKAKSVPADVIDKMPTLEKIGIATAALIRSHKSSGRKDWNGAAAEMVKMGYEAVADEMHQRALSSTVTADGGFTIAEDFNEEIFDELRPYTAFLRGGPDIMPMPNGNYRQSGVATRGSVGYRGEGTAIVKTQPTFREIDMSAKLLGGIIPITNQLINYSGQRAGRKAQQTLSVEMGVHMDSSAFEATGAGANPTGLFNFAGITTAAAAAATAPTGAQVEAALRPLINIIETFAQLQIGVAWVMPQRVIGYLQDLRDANGNLYFPTMSDAIPTFKTYPVLKCGTISTTGGVGTNETTIGIVSFGNILMGETGGLNIAVSDEASYDSGGGTMVSAFENDMTLIRATMEHDWQPVYNEAIGTLTAVQWGA